MDEALTPEGYMPRLVDAEVQAVLEGSPGLVIDGPKSCGKTWTALHHARSSVMELPRFCGQFSAWRSR